MNYFPTRSIDTTDFSDVNLALALQSAIGEVVGSKITFTAITKLIVDNHAAYGVRDRKFKALMRDMIENYQTYSQQLNGIIEELKAQLTAKGVKFTI
jgi:hypothetical protein